jgi:putative SOS response-associated peptidase YedK
MAGIYDQFEGENRFVILTAASNKSVSDIHDRMPVVLTKDEMEDWLFNNETVDKNLFGDHPDLMKRAS